MKEVLEKVAGLGIAGRGEGVRARAAEIMGREDLNQLPVVTNGRLAGIVSRAQILDFLRTRSDLKV